MTAPTVAHRYAAEAQGALRVMTALLYMQHGLQKMIHFPNAGHFPGPFDLFSLPGVAGVLEVFGGLAVALGLFTRPVAFVLCGEMAVAYWMVHFPSGLNTPYGFMPVVNNGDGAVLFCFIYLFLWRAGPGAWSLDSWLAARRT
jgi:putative oxidoreductase